MKASLLMLGSLTLNSMSYQPETPPPILEMWRWNQLEISEQYEIYCGRELSNGNLCFGSTDGLLIYDGYSHKIIPYPKGFRKMEPYDIRIQKNDKIYVYSSKGVFYYDGNWSAVLEFEIKRLSNREHFFSDNDGRFYVGTPIGIYELVEGRAQFIIDFKEIISSIFITSKNELFASFFRGNKIIQFPFSTEGIKNKENWKTIVFDKIVSNDICLIRHGKDEDVIAVNYDQGSSARRYYQKKKEWKTIDVGKESVGHSHMSAYRIDEATSIVFTKTALHILHNEEWYTIRVDEWDVPSNAAYVFKRKNGNLIMGGRNDKIWEIDLNKDLWTTYQGLNYQCDDPIGHSWFISVAGDIIEYNPQTKNWISHEGDILAVPKSIVADKDGTIWVSGSLNGVAAVSYYRGKTWMTNRHPELLSSISHLSAKVLSDGNIFFGCGHEYNVSVGGGILYQKDGASYRYEHLTYPQVPYRIVGVTELPNGLIFFGGNSLTYSDDLKKGTISTIHLPEVDWVDQVVSGPDGNLYAAVWEKGVFHTEKSDPKQLTRIPGSRFSRANDVLCDTYRKRNVWVSTSDGISRFDGESWIDNAIPNQIKLIREGGALKQSTDGSIWVNFSSREWYFRLSADGFVKSNPDFFKTIRFNPDLQPPQVEIVHVDNKVTEPANILIRWNGIDRWSRTSQQDLKYSIRVDGGDWGAFESKEELILMEMPHGNHSVEIRVRDKDANICRTPAYAEFQVIPLIWKRPWFLLTLISVILTIITLLILLIRQRVNHIIQLEEFKLQFFTNLSHEIRTPLTVIMWPLKSALEQLPDSVDKSQIEVAYRNSKKMSHLIDQILEFRKIETGKLESHIVVSNVVKDIQETIELLMPLAQEKKIKYSCGFSHENFDAKYDSEKMERIVSNLFSNAIKYSHENGSISLQVNIIEEKYKTSLDLVMEDNGVGIEKDKIKHIFEPFYRVNQGKIKSRGMGLGLSLVNSLITSMNGTIEVESPSVIIDGESRGTRFKISLPIKKSNIQATQIEETQTNLIASQTDSGTNDNQRDRDRILIVEDETEIRQFIANEFNKEYDTFTCENGKDALAKSKEWIPDLIITDIMMPKMDGNELIRRVRSEPSIRHIPIIALSALKSEEHILRSLNRGADDYISKPASLPVLRQKVKNIILARKRDISEYRKSSLGADAEALLSGSADDKFLKQCKDFAEARMNDPLFDVESLADEFDMSRMSLYRKFKAITGNTPGDFVREIKMQKAASLILQKELSISEISDAVGFQEVANFSKAFKKRFSVTPSKYRGHS